MTEPFLSHLPVRVQLAALFQMLVQTGMPPLAARAVLTDWIEQGIIEVTPALPRGWRLCLLDGGGITVETATGNLDATEVYVLQRTFEPNPEFVRERTALAEADRLWRRAQATLDAANEKVATVAEQEEQPSVVQDSASTEPPQPAPAETPTEPTKPIKGKSAAGAKELKAWEKIVPYLRAEFPDNEPAPSPNVSFTAAKDFLVDNKLAMADSTIRDGIKRHFPEWFPDDEN